MLRLRTLLIILALAIPFLAISVAGGPALAMGSDSDNAKADNPEFSEGVQAITDGKWEVAIAKLSKVVAMESANADAQNYLGYAYRKLGKLDQAFEHYAMALKIDPEHRGAHEYVGEAYLMAGNLAKAEEHLSKLDAICTFGCDEFYALKDAVAAYRAKAGG